jgi:hypothetical protein
MRTILTHAHNLPAPWIDLLFSRYRWYRRWRGGVWELWWNGRPGDRWHHLTMTSAEAHRRPTGICRGLPIVEDYR